MLVPLLSVAGCSQTSNPSYYFLARPHAVLLHDDSCWSLDDCPECNGWAVGANDGAPEASFVGASIFGALFAQRLLLKEGLFEGAVEITFNYEILRTDNGAFERSGEAYDYRVVLTDTASNPSQVSGPLIEASLFGLDGVRVLEVSREFPEGWSEPFGIGLQASGSALSGSIQVRAVDAITVKAGSP